MNQTFSEAIPASITPYSSNVETRVKNELHDLIPKIAGLIQSLDHNIGHSEYDHDEYEDNQFFFEEDGWSIEVNYRLCGKWCIESGDYWNPPCYDLIRTWGDVTSIIAVYCDDVTDDEVEFTESELTELQTEINKVLKSLA